MRLVGRAEKVLYPGRPRRGNVAIYLPGISNLWDTNSSNLLYSQWEIKYLHYALIHAGYTVDFVDDYDIAGGALQQRRYYTLYVTGPNVANDINMIQPPPGSSMTPSCQQQISLWVEQGGVLVVTPGGGVADEYNSQTSNFDITLGLKPNLRVANRDPFDLFKKVDTLTITNPSFGSGVMDISAPVVDLNTTTATTAASFSNGKPAITISSYGKGFGIAYAFFPAYHYQQSANWDIGPLIGTSAYWEPSQGTALPYGWGKIQRDVSGLL